MDFTREVVVPAALSEILGRIFAFLFDSFPRPSPGDRELHRRRLERLLGNIGSMVEEAEGRHITNQQLLSHLQVLTAGMYRGRFALEVTDLDDSSRNTVGDDDDNVDSDDTTTDAAASNAGKRSFALCPSFDRAKRSRVTSLILGAGASGSGGDGGTERLAAVVEELEGLTRDYMREFILLVQGYPRKVHRPVRTTLYMDRCVFGRHVEKERVVDFLLQRAPSGRAPYLSVLALVGAKKVGKTTLVKHACDDERVRGHFARIEWFETPDVVRAGGLPGQYMWESGGPEYLAGVRRILAEPRFAGPSPSLLVFEDAWPMDEAAWAALASSPTPLGDGSKLLLTCRDADLARLGTADPVVLHTLQQEEYWYYFKAFAFGGADPRDHPRVAAVAREISKHLERTFLDARVLGTLLRANFDARFWRRVLAAIVSCERRPMHVGVLLELLPVRGRLQSYGYCRSPPKFTVQDVLSAGASGHDGGSGSGSEEGFTVHLCRETLYMDHWYSITFKNDDRAPTPTPVVTT
ncbi:disease resistance protein RGA2-like [Miscanthus floridulus]|uniref:disease resistance protein RGA2-like n=1 Tax=Miscanthus floridulus TaxID=154761 RepID=UPI0034596ED8